MKRILAYIPIICLVLFLPIATVAESAQRGFATPEACAKQVFDALVQQDSQTLDDCFAFREMAERFEFADYKGNLNVISPLYTLLPVTSETNILYNESLLRQRLYMRVCYTSMWLKDQETSALVYKQMISVDSEEYQALYGLFTEDSGLAGYGALLYNGILKAADMPSVGEKYLSEGSQNSLLRQMACWQVDDYTELVVAALYGSKIVYMPLRLVQIEGLWYADPNPSNIGSVMRLNDYTMLAELE